MFRKERHDAIISELKKHGYTTVKYLTQKLHYSTATINRDLNELERQKIIKRSYGGAELIEHKGIPLPYRYDKMRVEKRLISHTAAEFVHSGDTIFIDGSTTAQSMARFLTEIENLTVITNNISLVSYLSEYGVNVICLGGKVQEAPSMLNGDITIMNSRAFRADKMFFSTGSVTDDGKIGGSSYNLMHTVMAENSEKIFYLADHDKINVKSPTYLFDFSRIDFVISDYDFSEETKQKYPQTKFVFVGK